LQSLLSLGETANAPAGSAPGNMPSAAQIIRTAAGRPPH
jgi:hypothetical protein